MDLRLQPRVQAAFRRRIHVKKKKKSHISGVVCVCRTSWWATGDLTRSFRWLVSLGTPCTSSTTASRCLGWCSATSGRVPTWWTASSRGPPRKPSSLFSWPRPPPSAWSSTWLSWHIWWPRLSRGRAITQSKQTGDSAAHHCSSPALSPFDGFVSCFSSACNNLSFHSTPCTAKYVFSPLSFFLRNGCGR